MKSAVWSMATGRASTGAIDELSNSKVPGIVDGPGDAYRHLLLSAELTRRKINWILDADIRSFFDEIDHEWMPRFLEHWIADGRVIRLIRKWLTAAVIEDGKRIASVRGTPQGTVISPLLENTYLHHALDLWAHQWRQRHAAGDVILVRYADDRVMGFQHDGVARRFLAAMRERLAAMPGSPPVFERAVLRQDFGRSRMQ